MSQRPAAARGADLASFASTSGWLVGALALVLLAPSPCRAVSPSAAPAVRDRAPMVPIESGTFLPFYPLKGEGERPVERFWIDAEPVRNVDFLRFVERAPEWRRSRVPALFADEAYLSHWSAELELGDGVEPEAPVTFVSWFAARAFCRAQGLRLPTESEWEYVARADATRRDASSDPDYRARIVSWYGRPQRGAPKRRVADEPANVWGVRGLHGVIWEWVEDWNASLVSVDDRRRGDRELTRFCGGAAIGASDVADYPAFMRIAFRSSLEARFAIHHLGFRCAGDRVPEESS